MNAEQKPSAVSRQLSASRLKPEGNRERFQVADDKKEKRDAEDYAPVRPYLSLVTALMCLLTPDN